MDVERPTAGERLLALFSLGALGGMVAVLVLGLVTNWLAAVVTILGLLVVVLGGWNAFAHRGPGRVAAVVVVTLGVGTAIAGLVIADLSVWRVLVAVVLGALALPSARAALRRSGMRRLARATTAVAPARHPVLIINPRSGGGRAERHLLVDECRARGIEPVVLAPGDDVRRRAEDAIAAGADALGVAGGDGSLALVADVAIHHDVPLVVVPAGTRNHFALDLGLDRDDVIGALDAFGDGVERRVDVASVNGRVFVNNASLGVYAKLVQSPSYRHAKRHTATATLPDLLGPGAERLDLRFTAPDGRQQSSAHLLLVSNGPYQLHRLAAGRFRRAELDRGQLGVVAARFATGRDLSRFLALEAAGRGRRFPDWFEWIAPRFRVDSDAAVDIGVDGEALVLDPPLLFESMPRVLRVRLPRAAVGPAAAARTVHIRPRSSITELARLVTGTAGHQ
jgi:diacylglycerol kinase family enzyme